MFLKNEFDQSDETVPLLYRARKELSDLHVRLADEGFTEVFVDQLTKDMVAVTRHCPLDRRLGYYQTKYGHISPQITQVKDGKI